MNKDFPKDQTTKLKDAPPREMKVLKEDDFELLWSGEILGTNSRVIFYEATKTAQADVIFQKWTFGKWNACVDIEIVEIVAGALRNCTKLLGWKGTLMLDKDPPNPDDNYREGPEIKQS